MALRIYNTLTRSKEEFNPLEPGQVSMYVCGPTVYDKAHVGHAMSSLVFDIVRRYLEYRGYTVKHVMNYTDVDDKIILRAQQEDLEPLEIADRYIREYDRHIAELNILPANIFPRATAEIDYIVEMVKGLVEKGYAYPADGDVYFRVEKDAGYGKLSGRRLDEMQAGARIEVDERKQHPMDFVVWKASKPGEPAWESPWGQGRPGWHIECSAMSLHHLGEQIDIHGGGNDLIFPHHENEIAQTEGLTGKPFAQYWLHNGMLQLSGEKMSKSLGNLVTIDEFLADHEAAVLRMVVLNSHYRSPLTFTAEVIAQAEQALERLRGALRPAFPQADGLAAEAVASLAEQVASARAAFIEAMDDDFNAPAALGHLFDLVRALNQARDAGATQEDLAAAQALLRELTGVFGLTLEREAKGAEAAPFIELLLALRQQLRAEKNWALADQLRDQLADLGVLIEDSPDGATWRWK